MKKFLKIGENEYLLPHYGWLRQHHRRIKQFIARKTADPVRVTLTGVAEDGTRYTVGFEHQRALYCWITQLKFTGIAVDWFGKLCRTERTGLYELDSPNP